MSPDGSSRLFSKALAAFRFIASAGSRRILAPTQLRRLGNETDQIADLIDPDGLVDFLGLEDVVIRMGLCGKQLAGLAFAAGAGLDRPLAEQQRHQLLGQQPFADAGGTM